MLSASYGNVVGWKRPAGLGIPSKEHYIYMLGGVSDSSEDHHLMH